MMDAQTIGFGFSLVGMLLSIYAMLRHRILHWVERRDFVKITYDGSWVIVRPGEEAAFIDEADDPSEYKIERVRMTMRQFESIPEFDGF